MSSIKLKKGMVYVLKLEHGCYYIGFTKWPDLRLEQHFSGNGAKFTQLHKPIKVLEVFQDVTKLMEHIVTKRYIKRYGASKVRGGRWCGTTSNSYCPYVKDKRRY